MRRKTSFSAAFQKFILFWGIFGLPVFSLASGRLIIAPKETLELTPSSDIFSAEFSWEVFEGEKKIDTLEGASFSRAFEKSGEYRIDITAQNEWGESEKTHIDVLVDEKGSSGFSEKILIPQLTTLPPMNEAGVISVSAENPSILFFGGASQGANEYHFDTDLSRDSNGDGDSENDTDNASDPSFLTGNLWSAGFSYQEKPILGRMTIVNDEGEKASRDFRIEFPPSDSKTKESSPLAARIDSIPPANKNGEIFLEDAESGRLVVFAGNSSGDIVQYRIDADLLVDSDGDGNSQNDIDNRESMSFHTGEPFSLPLNRENLEQVVRLTVVSREGKGSRLDRRIFLGQSASFGSESLVPRLFPKSKEIFVGNSLTFSLFGIPTGSEMSWDIGADGSIEHRGTQRDVSFTFDQEGDIPLVVQVTNGEFSAEVRDMVLVRSLSSSEAQANPPIADFSFQNLSENSFSFQNLSRSDARLGNPDMTYDWDFGDGNSTTDANPTHDFLATGEYSVSLKANDSVGNAAKKTMVIPVLSVSLPEEENLSDQTPTVPPPGEGDSGSVLISGDRDSLSIPWGSLFLTLFLVLFGGIIILLVIRKIQMPDLSLYEILEEEKERWFGGGAGAYSPSKNPPLIEKNILPVVLEPEKPPEVEIFSEQETPMDVEEDSPVSSVVSGTPPLDRADAPLPDWLRAEEVPTNEIKKEEEEDSDTNKKEDLPVWLNSENDQEEMREEINENIAVEAEDETPEWLQNREKVDSESFSEEKTEPNSFSEEQKEDFEKEQNIKNSSDPTENFDAPDSLGSFEDKDSFDRDFSEESPKETLLSEKDSPDDSDLSSEKTSEETEDAQNQPPTLVSELQEQHKNAMFQHIPEEVLDNSGTRDVSESFPEKSLPQDFQNPPSKSPDFQNEDILLSDEISEEKPEKDPSPNLPEFSEKDLAENSLEISESPDSSEKENENQNFPSEEKIGEKEDFPEDHPEINADSFSSDEILEKKSEKLALEKMPSELSVDESSTTFHIPHVEEIAPEKAPEKSPPPLSVLPEILSSSAEISGEASLSFDDQKNNSGV